MKRFNKILLSMSLFCLGACTDTTVESDDYVYILFATPLKEHALWLRAYEGFQDACDERNYKCDWIGPSTIDINDMNRVVETGIIQKADAIITQGVIDPDLLKKAHELEIPILLVDSDMPDSNRTAFFGKDFDAQSSILLEDIESKLGKEAYLKIAVQVTEVTFTIAQEQVAALEKQLATHPGGFEIVFVSESKSDKVRSKKEWYAVFQQYEDIDVAISFAGESGPSCYEAAASLKREKDVLIYGVDDMKETLQLLKEDKIAGSVIVPFYDFGYEAVAYLDDYFKQEVKEVNVIHPIEIEFVTPEKVEAYESNLP